MLRTPASTWRSGSIRCEEEARAGFADGAAWARAFAVDVNSIAATPDKAVPSMRRRCPSIGSWQISAHGRKIPGDGNFKYDTIMFLSGRLWCGGPAGITAMTGAIFGDTVSFVIGRRALPCCDPFPLSLPCWAR